MSKKKADLIEQQKSVFVYGGVNSATGQPVDGAIKRGVPEEIAIKIYDNIKPFARYAFNKSHAAAYAVLAYQTAYLKKYYPNQFLTSILNNRIDKSDEIAKYLRYLKSIGTPVYPPDINLSREYYKTENDGIRVGLLSLKNIGLAVIESIVKERDLNGDFRSFEDFISRCADFNMNKRMIENLIFAGAFDRFGHPRAELMAVYAPFVDKIAERNKRNNSAQISLFGTLINDDDYLTIDYPGLTEYNSKYKLSKEKEVVGVYLTGHPLSDFKEQFSKFSFTTRSLDYFTEDEEGERTYTEVTEGQKVHFGGIITAKDKIMTKSGSMMGFITVEDLYGQIECTLFSILTGLKKRLSGYPAVLLMRCLKATKRR
jgi:DNA polymerase-3 subunit alpha